MKYRTGEMAEFFGMTKEGIRFLERKGMIVSKRDERNGYRYFSRSEVSLLKHLRSYCAMGFSLEEAHRMICDTPQEELLLRLDEKIAELEEKEEQLRRMKAMLKGHRRAAECVLDGRDAFELCMSPELLYFPRLSDTLSAAERTVERTWIAAMPPVAMTAERDETGRETRGYSVRYEDALEMGLLQLDSMIRRPPMRCVHGIVEAPVPTLPDLAPMLSWARACGMEQCGAAICMVRLTYRHEDGNRWTIHEIFLPVQPENG